MRIKPLLPLVVFLAAIVAAGVAYGVHTDRWGRSPDRAAAAARLANIPLAIGPWVGEDRTVEIAELGRGVDGYLLREYRSPGVRQAITLFVVCGRPGPVAVHTPDVCYPASGYAMAAPQRETIGPATLWSATMIKPAAAVPESLGVRWAWRTSDPGWQAPDRPRVAFARAGVLYKIYALTDRAGLRGRTDPTADFLSLALPAIDRALTEEPAGPPILSTPVSD